MLITKQFFHCTFKIPSNSCSTENKYGENLEDGWFICVQYFRNLSYSCLTIHNAEVTHALIQWWGKRVRYCCWTKIFGKVLEF